MIGEGTYTMINTFALFCSEKTREYNYVLLYVCMSEYMYVYVWMDDIIAKCLYSVISEAIKFLYLVSCILFIELLI